MPIQFKQATRHSAKLRLAISGPPGSGKTYTALEIARGIGGRVVVIDTEHSTAEKYSDAWTGFSYDHGILDIPHTPARYVEAIKAAEAEGYDVIVLDSISHEWNGTGGILEQLEIEQVRRNIRSFDAWKYVTPLHNSFVHAMVASSCHIIATIRSKVEYSKVDDGNGRTVVKKLGMAPIQRDSIEYEFDLVADMREDHTLVVSKSRCSSVDGAVIGRPDQSLGVTMRDWLLSGAPVPSAPVDLKKVAAKCAEELTSAGVEDALLKLRAQSLVIAGGTTAALTSTIVEQACAILLHEAASLRSTPASVSEETAAFDAGETCSQS